MEPFPKEDPMDDVDELLTYRQVANLLGVKLATVYSLVSRRQIERARAICGCLGHAI